MMGFGIWDFGFRISDFGYGIWDFVRKSHIANRMSELESYIQKGEIKPCL